MLRLETKTEELDRVSLGEVLEFRLVRGDPNIETRVFLRHRPILYTRPLRDWTASDENLLLFPEAPGKYALLVQWRSPQGGRGWEEIDFAVVAGETTSPAPARVRLAAEAEIWAPSEWEAKLLQEEEAATVALLRAAIDPGAVVYDLGANIGFYASHMARLTGPRGHVYCVEANPICVQLLRANLLLQGLENVEVLPVAVLHHQGETRFTLNYGNSNLGLSEASGFYPAKTGHELRVPCFTFDHLIETFGLRPPDVVKVDVEGAEGWAVRGMRHTLAADRPTLVLELHGETCAASVLEILDRFGYRYADPVSGDELEGARAVCERFGDAVFQLLARA